jgi:hypothetical protein
MASAMGAIAMCGTAGTKHNEEVSYLLTKLVQLTRAALWCAAHKRAAVRPGSRRRLFITRPSSPRAVSASPTQHIPDKGASGHYDESK